MLMVNRDTLLRGNSMIEDVITYAGWGVTTACVAQIFWVFQYQQDLLGGLGVVNSSKDGIELIKLYGLVGAVSFSLATMKYIKLTAAGLAVFAASTFYGSAFHFNTDKVLNRVNMPSVHASKLDVADPLNNNAVNPGKPTAAVDKSGWTPEQNAAFNRAKGLGYVNRGAIGKAGEDWCVADEDNDGVKNGIDKDVNGETPGYSTEEAWFNCATGLKWVKG